LNFSWWIYSSESSFSRSKDIDNYSTCNFLFNYRNFSYYFAEPSFLEITSLEAKFFFAFSRSFTLSERFWSKVFFFWTCFSRAFILIPFAAWSPLSSVIWFVTTVRPCSYFFSLAETVESYPSTFAFKISFFWWVISLAWASILAFSSLRVKTSISEVYPWNFWTISTISLSILRNWSI